MKKVIYFILVIALSLGFNPINASNEDLKEVLPGDEPIIIKVEDVNEYEQILENYQTNFSKSFTGGRSIESINDTINELESYKKLFDEQVEKLDKTYSDEELLHLGYTTNHVKTIREYSYDDNDRIQLAATYSGYITLNQNYYNASAGRSEVSFTYNASVSGVMLRKPTVAVGIQSSNTTQFVKQGASMNARYEFSNGTGDNYGGNEVISTLGAINHLPIVAGGANLVRFSYTYKGFASGNHRVIALLASTAVPTIAVDSVTIGFSGQGKSLAFTLKPSSSFVNKLSHPVNR